MIREAVEGDAQRIAEIYNHYVETSTVTFEEEPVAPDEMVRRMAVGEEKFPWLVLVGADEELLGYAYASPWKGRCAYRYSVETTVYLDHASCGTGCGTRLYQRLLAELRNRSLHTAMAGIALPNAASVALHEKLGFTKVAHFREVGWKFGEWVDVGYWQCLLG